MMKYKRGGFVFSIFEMLKKVGRGELVVKVVKVGKVGRRKENGERKL